MSAAARITLHDFEDHESPLPVDEVAKVKVVDDAWPRCLACNEEITFDETAMETITFRRMCENRQSVFQCPACKCRHAIYAEGEVPTTSGPGELVVHPPEGGYYLAKVLVAP